MNYGRFLFFVGSSFKNFHISKCSILDRYIKYNKLMAKQTLKDKFYKDKNGRITLLQLPNLPLITWFIARIGFAFTSGTTQTVFELISFGAIFTWAWLEIFDGANYSRRALGSVVMIGLLYGRL